MDTHVSLRSVLVGIALAVSLVAFPSASETQERPPERAGSAEASASATPGKFTVRVRAAGLVVLVPSTSGKSLGILMVDAPARASASNGCVVPRHIPQLGWKAGTCEIDGVACRRSSATLNRGDFRIEVLGGGATRAAAGMDLGHLTSLADRPTTAAPPPPRQGSGPAKALGAEWVLHVGELYKGSGSPELEAGCLSVVPGVDCPVFARLALDRGTVRTCRLSEIEVQVKDPQSGKLQPKLETWAFDMKALGDGSKARGFKPRTLATVTEIAWEETGTGIEIAGVPYGGTKARTRLRLTPKDGEIVVDFLNLPDHTSVESQPGCDPQRRDFHFERLYSLATAPPEVLYVPHAAMKVDDVQPDCNLLSGVSEHGGEALPPDVGACVHKTYEAHPDVDDLFDVPVGE